MKKVPLSWVIGKMGYEAEESEKQMRMAIICILSLILYFIFWRKKNDK